jgi:hypothetical protein
MITDAYKAALLSPTRHQIYKIEWMDKDENIYDEITTDTLDGSISISLANGTRRSCSLSLKNNDFKFTPDRNGLVYIGKKFKLYSGLLIDGVEVFPDESIQGVFNIANPILQSNPASESITIEGYDNFCLMNGNNSGVLEAVYVINIDTEIDDVVISVFAEAGIIKKPLIDYSGSYTTVQYTITKEVGSTYEEILTDLANFNNQSFYFDVSGRPIFEDKVDELNTYHSWVFDKTKDSFLNYQKNFDFVNVRNSVAVWGDNINGDQAYSLAEDNGVLSQTSISRIGKRTKVITDTMITDDILAYDRANYELKNATDCFEYVDIKCLNIDFLKEGDIILLNDPDNKIDFQRYIIRQISRSLGFNQEMSINATRVREVSTGT